jgi:CHASE3 domain sensor protein
MFEPSDGDAYAHRVRRPMLFVLWISLLTFYSLEGMWQRTDHERQQPQRLADMNALEAEIVARGVSTSQRVV